MIGKQTGTGLFAIVLAGSAWGQVTRLVSVASSGVQGNDDCATFGVPRLTPDGRYVAFWSLASNLVPGDTNGKVDMFVRDLQTGATDRVDVDSSGAQGNGTDSDEVIGITPDARFVAFETDATNLVLGDTNAVWDVFLRDRQTGTTTRVSLDSSGIQGNSYSLGPAISDDGRFVAFESLATNLVPGDINGFEDVFVRDFQTGTTEIVSVDSSGVPGNGLSLICAISADGRFVAYESDANNLVPGDTNGSRDVFLRDRTLGTTERVELDSSGAQGGAGISFYPCLSADGRFVAYYSEKSDLVVGDTNGVGDIFVRDRQLGTTERVSISTGGTQGNGSSAGPVISGDGRYVAFRSTANNLVAGDTNGSSDVFIHDRQAGTTELASITFLGGQGNASSYGACLSADGRYVSFHSSADNFVPRDTNNRHDVFVRDRFGGTDFIVVCEPGTGGVAACPCSNAPSGPGRGCDNSAGTGGATLSATGATSLSSDSLVFTTSGERPTALSVVFQGTTSISGGILYGQGVRCAGGTLKRLFSKNAVGGAVTVPIFGAGDPTVSARSAAKGDVIPPGGIRHYFVAYRDPFVLGSCPATSTFNVTTTGKVSWSP